MKELLGMQLHELTESLSGPSYRALQVFEWIDRVKVKP